MRYLSLFSLLILVTGCQTLLKSALGFEKEQALTDRQVYACIQQRGWQQMESVRVDSTAYEALKHEVYKPGWEVGFRPLQFLVYDPQGKLIAQYASCEGFLTAKNLAAFPPVGLQLPDTTRRLKHLLGSCHSVVPAATAATGGSEYVIAVYWISWTGRQSIQLIERMRQYAAAQADKKVRVVLVNADYYPGTI